MTTRKNHSHALATDRSLMTDDCSAENPLEDGQGLPESERPRLRLRAQGTDLELPQLTDEQLTAQLSLGRNDALAVPFDRCHRLVFSIALRILRDSGEAEDVVHTVFLNIFRSVGQFDPAKGDAKIWILQYAYHRALKMPGTARSFGSLSRVPKQRVWIW